MKWFDYAAPVAVEDAVRLLGGGDAAALAGGTDLLVQMQGHRKEPALVVDVKKIAELNAIELTGAGLTLGAAVPCYRITGSAEIRRGWPGLAEVAGWIGGTQIQGRASIGGNLCNAAPSADSVPLLIAMAATCEIAGPGGRRQVAVEDFCVAPGKSVLAAGEILVSLKIPSLGAGAGARYLRFIPRNEMDIAVAGAGVMLKIDGGIIREARVALSSVAPTPLFVREAGTALIGKPAEAASFHAAAEAARAAAKPISDMRGTADYRRHLCGVLVQRALDAALSDAKGAN